jgi:hypothetical protein
MNVLIFDIDKTVAAAAYLIKKSGGKLDGFVLLKMMYDAERIALLNWHRPITGDNFCSMPKGPVLSRTYDLIKYQILSQNSDMQKWAKYISPRDGHALTLLQDPDFDFLSDQERGALDKSFAEINGLIAKHGLIAKVLHGMWPEWEDPGGGSTPIDPITIIRQAVNDEDELARIDEDLRASQAAKAAFHTG